MQPQSFSVRNLLVIRLSAWLAACCLFVLITAGCKPLQINQLHDRVEPSNHRDWEADVAKLPYSEINDGLVKIYNVRNCRYVTEQDFVVEHFDRTFRLDEITSVDFVVVPFNQTPLLAHTMLSFGLRDNSRLGVSIEVRKEKGEKYSPLWGATRQFEIAYVIADERDLIRLRTHHRDADVFVYPTVASAVQAQQLFVNVLKRANELTMNPEFYHSLTNNCTTNLAGHVNQVADNRILYSWRVLLPGFSARYAYDLGLLPNDVPFEDLQAMAYVNDLADEHFHDPHFSEKIRSRQAMLHRLVTRQQTREPLMRGAGDRFLLENYPSPFNNRSPRTE